MDWPDDVAAVADALELGPLLLLSFSAGTPFLLACCVHLRGRVLAGASVAGLAPLDRPGALDAASVARRTWWAIARHRRAIRALDVVMARAVRVRPHDVVDRRAQKAPPPESRRLREPDVLADMVEAYRQALAQGAGAVAHEHHLLASSWGFSLDHVRVSGAVVHGDDDRLLRAENSRWLASQLAHAEARIVPRAGHFLVLTQGEEIARDLVLASKSIAARRACLDPAEQHFGESCPFARRWEPVPQDHGAQERRCRTVTPTSASSSRPYAPTSPRRKDRTG